MSTQVSALFTRLCLVEKSEEKSLGSRFVFRFLDLDFSFLRTLNKYYYLKRIIITLQHFAVPYLGISLGNKAEDEDPLDSQSPCWQISPVEVWIYKTAINLNPTN